MKFYIYKGSRASEGARTLQQSLGATMMRSEGSVYRGRARTCVINWGTINAEAARLAGIAPTFLNHPDKVKTVANKLTFFKKMRELLPDHTIPFAENIAAANDLVLAGGRVFARTELNGHSGSGIVLMATTREGEIQAVRKVRDNNLMPVHLVDQDRIPNNLATCQLFTQGIQGKRTEFRVHIIGGREVLTQVKLRKEGHADNPLSNTIVRNVASGWVYGVNTAAETRGYAEAVEAAKATVAAFGLDFGAVDIVFKEDTSKAYVLEVNTAPGLADEGSALEKYTTAFKELFNV